MNSFISRGTLAMCLAAITSPAFAQEGTGGIEEIVVTAQKRSESLQKTPISMMAMTGADIEKKGIADITDLRTLVPSLAVTPHPNSATTARVFIRGIGNNDDQITVDPSVAVYLDGIYIARNQGLSAEVAEVERIEVLRGPQGSLYGRNATGGAINYITRAPELGDFSAKQTFAIGNYDQFRSRTRIN
ncbi:MAG TPA: TonB-dependent receptor plug domain-containing protein, partial [Sphingobium sp.]|nr:TonB-dependent receptor plug domain-containing protein [Sphingobium sp.]